MPFYSLNNFFSLNLKKLLKIIVKERLFEISIDTENIVLFIKHPVYFPRLVVGNTSESAF